MTQSYRTVFFVYSQIAIRVKIYKQDTDQITQVYTEISKEIYQIFKAQVKQSQSFKVLM